MTLGVGIETIGGIVVASDSRATVVRFARSYNEQ